MKRQTIRLTESDLQRIIKESVKRIIKERVLSQDEKFTPYTKEEGERNRKAIWQGSPEDRNPAYAKAKAAAQKKGKGTMEEGSLQELDPRTYASYAQKRQQQGGLQNQWKATDGQQAAMNAWNQKYGKNTYNSNNMGQQSNQTFMNNDYSVQSNHGEYGYGNQSRTSQRNYNPQNNTYSYQSNTRDYQGNNQNQQNTQGHGYGNEGERVANQMAQGNGKYVKGKGWQ